MEYYEYVYLEPGLNKMSFYEWFFGATYNKGGSQIVINKRKAEFMKELRKVVKKVLFDTGKMTSGTQTSLSSDKNIGINVSIDKKMMSLNVSYMPKSESETRNTLLFRKYVNMINGSQITDAQTTSYLKRKIKFFETKGSSLHDGDINSMKEVLRSKNLLGQLTESINYGRKHTNEIFTGMEPMGDNSDELPRPKYKPTLSGNNFSNELTLKTEEYIKQSDFDTFKSTYYNEFKKNRKGKTLYLVTMNMLAGKIKDIIVNPLSKEEQEYVKQYILMDNYNKLKSTLFNKLSNVTVDSKPTFRRHKDTVSSVESLYNSVRNQTLQKIGSNIDSVVARYKDGAAKKIIKRYEKVLKIKIMENK